MLECDCVCVCLEVMRKRKPSVGRNWKLGLVNTIEASAATVFPLNLFADRSVGNARTPYAAIRCSNDRNANARANNTSNN